MTIQETIQDIRKRCRLAMNGVVSASMRGRGLSYKLNFGLVISQIKDLANSYTPDASLAESLWKQDTRELKIMATMLYPADQFSIEEGRAWIAEIPNQEIREQLAINLLQKLPFACEQACESSNADDANIRATGYWLFARLFLTKSIKEVVRLDSSKSIWEDINSEDLFLRNAALLFLKHVGRQNAEIANEIVEKVSSYKESDSLLEKEIYNNLSFEFEYYYGAT